MCCSNCCNFVWIFFIFKILFVELDVMLKFNANIFIWTGHFLLCWLYNKIFKVYSPECFKAKNQKNEILKLFSFALTVKKCRKSFKFLNELFLKFLNFTRKTSPFSWYTNTFSFSNFLLFHANVSFHSFIHLFSFHLDLAQSRRHYSSARSYSIILKPIQLKWISFPSRL